MPADTTPRIHWTDIVLEAALAVGGRRTRTLLTASGVALGITAAMATVGITLSAANAVSDRFDALRSTLVTITYPDQGHPGVPRHPPATDIHRLNTITGVTQAGFATTASTDVPIGRLPPTIAGPTPQKLTLIAAQPVVPQLLGATLDSGRWSDNGFETRKERVALLDTVAARDLGMPPATTGPARIYINGLPYTVTGTFLANTGDTRLTGSIVLPYWAADDPALTTAQFQPTQAMIRTRIGAAATVGDQAPLALTPQDPTAPIALVPPELTDLRQGVRSDTQALFLGLALVSLIIGALGVSNTMLVSVLERRPEIGLRRAVGATRTTIATQFLLESGLVGLTGGTLGTILGINATIATCLAKGWLLILDPTLIAAGPLLGLTVGMLAGLHPALSAAHTEPATSLHTP